MDNKQTLKTRDIKLVPFSGIGSNLVKLRKKLRSALGKFICKEIRKRTSSQLDVSKLSLFFFAALFIERFSIFSSLHKFVIYIGDIVAAVWFWQMLVSQLGKVSHFASLHSAIISWSPFFPACSNFVM